MSGANGIISPDYPGIARSRIEQTLGCKALFLPGCFGNIRPAILSETGGFASATREQLDACGHELGDEVCRVAKGLNTRSAEGISARRTDMAIPYGDLMPEEELKKMAADKSERGQLLTGPWARKVLDMAASDTVPTEKPTEMQLMQIGPIALITIPGEPVQEIGHAMEKRLRDISEDLLPVGYANDEVGYLCTERQYEEGGYEPNAYPYYGEPGAISGRRRDHLANSRRFSTELKMKQIDIPYGRGAVSVSADPKLAYWDVIRPAFEPALEDPKQLFHEAVRHPLGTKPLREIVKPSDRVVIATSDGTRPVPNKQLIPWLLEELPVSPDQITVLIGTGTHRPNTKCEIVEMFGKDLVRRVRIINHDAF